MISDRMVDAFNQAHNAIWKAAAPVTQCDAVTVHRQAVRAGLEAALATQAGVFPKPPPPTFATGPTSYQVVRLPGEWAYSVQEVRPGALLGRITVYRTFRRSAALRKARALAVNPPKPEPLILLSVPAATPEETP